MSFIPLFCPNPTYPHHHRQTHFSEEDVLLTKDGQDVFGQRGLLGRLMA